MTTHSEEEVESGVDDNCLDRRRIVHRFDKEIPHDDIREEDEAKRGEPQNIAYLHTRKGSPRGQKENAVNDPGENGLNEHENVMIFEA